MMVQSFSVVSILLDKKKAWQWYCIIFCTMLVRIFGKKQEEVHGFELVIYLP